MQKHERQLRQTEKPETLLGVQWPSVFFLKKNIFKQPARNETKVIRSRDQAALQGQGLLPVLPHRSELQIYRLIEQLQNSWKTIAPAVFLFLWARQVAQSDFPLGTQICPLMLPRQEKTTNSHHGKEQARQLRLKA